MVTRPTLVVKKRSTTLCGRDTLVGANRPPQRRCAKTVTSPDRFYEVHLPGTFEFFNQTQGFRLRFVCARLCRTSGGSCSLSSRDTIVFLCGCWGNGPGFTARVDDPCVARMVSIALCQPSDNGSVETFLRFDLIGSVVRTFASPDEKHKNTRWRR